MLTSAGGKEQFNNFSLMLFQFFLAKKMISAYVGSLSYIPNRSEVQWKVSSI